MKRMVNVLGKLSGGKRTYAVFALYAMTAIALPAQTLTTLHRFEGKDGALPMLGWSRPPMGTSTGQPTLAGSTTMGRSSRSLRAGR